LSWDLVRGPNCGILRYSLLIGPEEGEAHPLNIFQGKYILVTVQSIVALHKDGK